MATEHEVDRLVVRLTGDQSAYQKMITQVEKQTEEAANWAQRMGAKITDSFTSAFRTAQGMLSSIGSTSIKGGAALTGMSAAITAPLGKAALDFSSYGEGLATIVRQTDDAAKSAALLKKELKDNTVAFKELSKVIELTEKQAATYKLMSDRTGLSIKTLSDTVKTTTEEYKKWEAEAEKFGLVLTKDQIKAATDLAESWTRVKQSLRGLWVQVGEAVGKGFKDWNDLITSIITRTTQWVKENKALIQTIAVTAEKVAAVGTVLIGVGTALSTVSTFLAPIAAMVAAGAAAWLAWDTATGKFLRGQGARAWEEYGESVKSAYNKVVSYGKDIVAYTDKIVAGVFDAIKAGNIELAVNVLWSGAKVAWLRSLNELDELTNSRFAGIIKNIMAGDFSSAWKSLSNSVKITFLEIEKAADPLWVKMEESFAKVAAVIKKAWNEVYFFIIDIVQKLMTKLGELLDEIGESKLVKFTSPEMARGAKELGLSLREARTKMLDSVLEPDATADQARADYNKAKKELEDKKAELAKEEERVSKISLREKFSNKSRRERFFGASFTKWGEDAEKAAGSNLRRAFSGGEGFWGKSTNEWMEKNLPRDKDPLKAVASWLGKGMAKDAKDFANFSMETIKGSSKAERAQAEKDLKAAEEQVASKKKEVEKLEEQYAEANLKKRIAESKESRGRGISEEETGKLMNIRANAEERTLKLEQQITKLKAEQEELIKKGNEAAAKKLEKEQALLGTQLKQVEAEKAKADQALANAQATAEKSNAERRAQEEAVRLDKEKEAIEERFKDPIKKYNEDLDKLNKLFKDGERGGRAYKEALKALQRELLSSNFNVNVHFGMTGLDAVKSGTQEWLAIVESGLQAIQDDKTLKKAGEQAKDEANKAPAQAPARIPGLPALNIAFPKMEDIPAILPAQVPKREINQAETDLDRASKQAIADVNAGKVTPRALPEEAIQQAVDIAGAEKNKVSAATSKPATEAKPGISSEEKESLKWLQEIAAHTKQMTVLLGASSQDRNRAEKAVNLEGELPKASKLPELTAKELPKLTVEKLPKLQAEEETAIAEVQKASDRQRADRAIPPDFAKKTKAQKRPWQTAEDLEQKRADRELRHAQEKNRLAASIRKRSTKPPKQTTKDLESKKADRDLRHQQEKNKLVASMRRRNRENAERAKKKPSFAGAPEKPVATEVDKKSLETLLSMSTAMGKLADRPIVQLEPLGVVV